MQLISDIARMCNIPRMRLNQIFGEATTAITLETTYGLDIETDFISGETIERFQADVKLSDGEYHVVLELRS